MSRYIPAFTILVIAGVGLLSGLSAERLSLLIISVTLIQILVILIDMREDMREKENGE